MRTFALAALVTLAPALLFADEKSKDLFDGKSLDGWKVEKCEVEVKDGCIFLKGGNGWMRTEKEYGDFVLELDWKSVKTEKFDSGVYIRAVPITPKQNWPAKNQVNLREDLMASIKEFKEAAPRPELTKKGEWNHFKLTVVGSTAELEFNGTKAWKINDLKPASGYIGLQCEVPAGGQFYFRNVRISER